MEKKLNTHYQGVFIIYLRFIVDIFFTRTINKKDLMNYLNELNTKHESIKFEYQISNTNITFLDTEVYINNNKLYTNEYQISKANIIFLDTEVYITNNKLFTNRIVKHSSTSTLNTLNL